jgi:hypothetical protein
MVILKVLLAGIYLGNILWWFMEIHRLGKRTEYSFRNVYA